MSAAVVASDEVRNGVATGIGDFLTGLGGMFVSLFETLGGLGIVGVFAGILLIWKLSLVLGPMKVCWRCGGDGHVGGLLGGRRECGVCGGVGRRPRIGAGK